MTDFNQLYRSKLTTADELARRAQSGWVIGMDGGPAQTPAIISAIARRVREDDLSGLKVHTLLDVYPYEFYADDSLAGKMTGYSWFSSAGARKAINGGYGDFIPAYYRDIPGLMRGYDFDAYCVAVSPMDKHGYFSLGLTSSCCEALFDRSKRIFVEVNAVSYTHLTLPTRACRCRSRWSPYH